MKYLPDHRNRCPVGSRNRYLVSSQFLSSVLVSGLFRAPFSENIRHALKMDNDSAPVKVSEWTMPTCVFLSRFIAEAPARKSQVNTRCFHSSCCRWSQHLCLCLRFRVELECGTIKSWADSEQKSCYLKRRSMERSSSATVKPCKMLTSSVCCECGFSMPWLFLGKLLGWPLVTVTNEFDASFESLSVTCTSIFPHLSECTKVRLENTNILKWNLHFLAHPGTQPWWAGAVDRSCWEALANELISTLGGVGAVGQLMSQPMNILQETIGPFIRGKISCLCKPRTKPFIRPQLAQRARSRLT